MREILANSGELMNFASPCSDSRCFHFMMDKWLENEYKNNEVSPRDMVIQEGESVSVHSIMYGDARAKKKPPALMHSKFAIRVRTLNSEDIFDSYVNFYCR